MKCNDRVQLQKYRYVHLYRALQYCSCLRKKKEKNKKKRKEKKKREKKKNQSQSSDYRFFFFFIIIIIKYSLSDCIEANKRRGEKRDYKDRFLEEREKKRMDFDTREEKRREEKELLPCRETKRMKRTIIFFRIVHLRREDTSDILYSIEIINDSYIQIFAICHACVEQCFR